MGLRARLSLLLTAILFVALLGGAAYSLSNARRAVQDELRASTELASRIVKGLHVSAPDGERAAAALVREFATVPRTRHLHVGLETRGESGPQARAAQVPGWFSRLVTPEPGALTRQVTLGTAGAGADLVIAADPADEIEEAWRETRATLAILLAAFVGAVLVVIVFLGRALRPLESVSGALAGVERGDYALRLPLAGLPDVDRIAERFNHMAATLERSRAENAMLAQRSLAMQEDERRHLAQELHDEMGQSLTAIRALAATIGTRTSGRDPDTADSAMTIVDVSGDVYERVRLMMRRLHPAILDELGLTAALALMVDDWNVRHGACFCSLAMDERLPELDHDTRIAVYRIVQECLTNVARHAEASEVRVVLAMEEGATGAACVTGEVSDNGRGFEPATVGRGLGMVGIGERLAALGGTFALDAAPGRGTRVAFRVPLGRTANPPATGRVTEDGRDG